MTPENTPAQCTMEILSLHLSLEFLMSFGCSGCLHTEIQVPWTPLRVSIHLQSLRSGRTTTAIPSEPLDLLDTEFLPENGLNHTS